MKIKRTELADRSSVQIFDPWSEGGAVFADTVHVATFPTHSPVLGPDGSHLEYEPRVSVGFDLGAKK